MYPAVPNQHSQKRLRHYDFGRDNAFGVGFCAVANLSGQPTMLEEFGKIDLGQGFRTVAGIVERVRTGLLLWPREVWMGALRICGICVGAFAAQLGPLDKETSLD